VIAVNFQEAVYGAAPGRLEDMVEGFHPAIRAVRGTREIAAALGGIRNVPAGFVFDRNGKVAFDFGGVAEPDSWGGLRRKTLERVLGRLR
jgi:hypothetical protein